MVLVWGWALCWQEVLAVSAGFGVLVVDNPLRARESGRGAVRPIIAIFHCGVVIVAAATLQQQGWGGLCQQVMLTIHLSLSLSLSR